MSNVIPDCSYFLNFPKEAKRQTFIVISMAEQNVGIVLNRNEESLTRTNEITPGLSDAQIKSNSIEFEN